MHTELSSPKKGLHVSETEGTGPLWPGSGILACGTICELAKSPSTEPRFFLGAQGRRQPALGSFPHALYLH